MLEYKKVAAHHNSTEHNVMGFKHRNSKNI